MTARVVAIDGPSGSGKSTTARGVAEELGLEVLDTGAMYRAVTVAALEAGIDVDDIERVVELCAKVTLDTSDDGRTLLDGRDVTERIRGPEVTAAVSAVAANPGVRTLLVERQRQWVHAHGGGVVEGRDIGTVVFPDATVKVYLVASADERARRRQLDEAAAERSVAVTDVRESLNRRDQIDSSRATAPLRAADDAVELDTTALTVSEVVAEIVGRFEDEVAR